MAAISKGTTPHAIETVYQGYRFRSRLEARWAVFFDTLGVKWEYEKEGYDLGEAGWYLPDFWLPVQKSWVEIRPGDRFFYDHPCQELANQTQRRAIYVAGEPFLGSYGICLYEPFGQCSGSTPMVFGVGRRDGRELWVTHPDVGAICLNSITDDDKWPLVQCAELEAAYHSARGARFGKDGRG